MGQAQHAQLNSVQKQSQPNQSSQNHLQKNQNSSENLESNLDQVNKQQLIQNTNNDQNQQEFIENIDEEIQSGDDIEKIWLTRTFDIFTNTQQIYGKQVDFIPKDQQLTVDIIIEEMYYQFLTSSQFTEQEKLQYLIKSLISLSDFKVQNEQVILAEGKIQKDKYFKLLNHIQGQLLTCTLYPDAFEWQNVDEDPNILDDVKNYRADIIFNSLFCSNNLDMAQNAIKNIFDYLETSANEDDSFKFIELILKRELRLYKRLTFDTQLQLHSLALLQILVKYQKLMEVLILNSWAFGKFNQIDTGNYFQRKSILGILLSLSAFPTDGNLWKSYFSEDKVQMNNQMNDLRNKIFNIMDQICILFETIFNSNQKLRSKLFQLFSKIIKLNLNLEKQLNVQLQQLSSSPGLVFNFLYILSYLFNQYVNSQTNDEKCIKKIDLNLLSYCQKHPLFSDLYQNVDLLASELTPFVEPEEFATVIDPLTTLFLLTQRINHIVATSLDQFYIQILLQEIKQLPPEAFFTQAFDRIQKQKTSYDLQILHPKSIKYIMHFLSFANELASSLIDQDLKPKYPYGLLSSTFLIDTQIFVTIYTFNDQILNHSLELQKCFEYAVTSMNKNLIANPHLRIRSINLFQVIDNTKGQLLPRDVRSPWNQQQELKLLFISNTLRMYLIDGIIQSFIDTEKIAEENQFFQKLHIRFKFCFVMRYFLQEQKDLYEPSLINGFKNQQNKYLYFSNYFLNDLIFLTEECFQSIKNIKNLSNEQPFLQNNHYFHRIMREFIKKSQYFCEYLSTLEVLSSILPEIFLIDEIREILANHLNYILHSINGKQQEEYQTNLINEKTFDRLLISEILIKIYINLSQNAKFLPEVVKDDRCFSIELFQNTQNLIGQYIIQEKISEKMKNFINQIEDLNDQQKIISENPDDIPEEFLDPLCFSLMKDPVRLPHSNVVVDRLTIKKHLLNKQIDPFDRTPLTLEMVIEQTELKQKIEKYLEEKLQKQKTLNQEQK